MKPLRAALLLAAALLVAGAAGAVALSSAAAEELVHPDRKASPRTPADFALAYEEVAFEAADGVPLSAWWIPGPDDDAPVVVFFHGYGEGKWQGLPLARHLRSEGYAVLLPDFRAHGASGGEFTTVGLLETRDVAGAVTWLRETLPCERHVPVALVGWSMGGAAVLNAAPHLDVDAVVTDSAFADLQSLVGAAVQRYTGLPAFPFARLTVFAGERMTGIDIGDNRPESGAARMAMPLLVVHGTADDVTDAAAAERLRDAHPSARLLLVQGAGHVSSWDVAPGAYQEALATFLDEAFAPASDPW